MTWGARNLISTQVRRLNKAADTVIRRDFGNKVTVRRDAYNFTVNLEDEAYLRGDARHPASGALKSLVSLLFVEDACDYGRLARGLVGRWWQDW